MRSDALGFRKRNKQRIFRQRVGVNVYRPESGVPSMGMRKLTGRDSTESSRKANARSTMSPEDSPMPTSAPLHGESPAFLTLSTVSKRSAYVCVEQMSV